MTRADVVRDIAYARVLNNLRTAQKFVLHAVEGLPESTPASAVCAVKDVRDELRTAIEMVEEAEVDIDALKGHLEVLADALATPGKGSA